MLAIGLESRLNFYFDDTTLGQALEELYRYLCFSTVLLKFWKTVLGVTSLYLVGQGEKYE